MFLRRLATGLAAAGVMLAIPAGGSALAGVRTGRVPSGDAGYVVSGVHFDTVETWVKLPNASRFAAEIGFLGVSVQLWTSRTVLDLKAVACTDSTCRPGGRPVTRYYRLEFDVYSRKTGALVCASSAAGPLRCPDVPRSFTRARFAPGRTVMLDLAYVVPWDFVFAIVEDQLNGANYNYPVTAGTVPAKPTKYFRQARVAVELGNSPWAPVHFHAPRAAVRLVSFDRPVPPPYAAEIAALSGRSGGFVQKWWRHYAVAATVAGSALRTAARPGPLWDAGYGFTVYLRP